MKKVNTIFKMNSINTNIKSRSMKKLFKIIILILISQNVNAQNYTETAISRNETTLLLDQLKVKVSEIKSVEEKLANTSLNSNEIEQLKNQISNLQKDMIIFLYHSIQERCTVENRLLEISKIVQPIDSKLAEKFSVLDQEQIEKR